VSELAHVAWPVERAAQAMAAVAADAGLEPRLAAWRAPRGRDDDDVSHLLDDTAAALGLESEPIGIVHTDLRPFLRGSGPSLLKVELSRESSALLAIRRGGRRAVDLLAPDGRRRRVSLASVERAVSGRFEELTGDLAGALDRARIPPARRARALSVMATSRLRQPRIAIGWLVRLRPDADARRWSRQERVGLRIAAALIAHVLHLVLFLLGWALVGRAALEGRLEPAWIAAWAILLVFSLCFRSLTQALARQVALSLSTRIKSKLLAQALAFRPEDARVPGAAGLLGTVTDSQAVERLVSTGALTGILATFDMAASAVVLAHAASGAWLVSLFAAWTAASLLLAWRHRGSHERWTDSRAAMTSELVERMLGHRTRLAQEQPGSWHDGEDVPLARYLDRSRRMDRDRALRAALVPRGWLVVGLIGLAPALLGAGEVSTARLAIGVGGILFGMTALERWTGGLQPLFGWIAAARQAWDAPRGAVRARDPMDAHETDRDSGTDGDSRPADGELLLEARGLGFGYHEGEPVVRDWELALRVGDRILLEGPSGAGKSTLASILSGIRLPTSGRLLLGGRELHAVGSERWRRRVALVPQFHENHMFSGTVAFNLLLGRAWPPEPHDLVEADALCRELGLGRLLDRMPAGLHEMLGETGWQLSHGERSLLYVARALLQGADLVILDESFAALDPDTLRRAFDCVTRRARTLLLIAHP
jgi:ATP-binding cassette subfamily B protein